MADMMPTLGAGVVAGQEVAARHRFELISQLALRTAQLN
jgi:hypothetical protein